MEKRARKHRAWKAFWEHFIIAFIPLFNTFSLIEILMQVWGFFWLLFFVLLSNHFIHTLHFSLVTVNQLGVSNFIFLNFSFYCVFFNYSLFPTHYSLRNQKPRTCTISPYSAKLCKSLFWGMMSVEGSLYKYPSISSCLDRKDKICYRKSCKFLST